MSQKPSVSVEHKPAKTTGEDAMQAAHATYFEEYRTSAEALAARLPEGYSVRFGKAWKGYSLTLVLPKK